MKHYNTLGIFTHWERLGPEDRMLTFIDSAVWMEKLSNPEVRGITAVVTTRKLAPLVPKGIHVILSETPKEKFYWLHLGFKYQSNEGFIDPSARIDPSAFIDPSAIILDDVSVGKNVYIGKNVVLWRGSRVEDCAMIGVNGFSAYRFKKSNQLLYLNSFGGVFIGCSAGPRLRDTRATVQSGALIASGLFSRPTTIGCGTIVGNKANIGHDAMIGLDCLIGPSALIAGNTEIGDQSWIGPNATVSHCLKLGEKSSVALGSVVVEDVPAGRKVYGRSLGCFMEPLIPRGVDAPRGAPCH